MKARTLVAVIILSLQVLALLWPPQCEAWLTSGWWSSFWLPYSLHGNNLEIGEREINWFVLLYILVYLKRKKKKRQKQGSVFCHNLEGDKMHFLCELIHRLRYSMNACPEHLYFGQRPHWGLCPGRTLGNQQIPKQMFGHSGQLAVHLWVIYLLSCLWCCPKGHLGSSKTRHEKAAVFSQWRNE